MSVLLLWTGGAAAEARPAVKTYKILHLMSYHSPWRWTDGQLDGFREGLGDVRFEVKVVQMDLKRNGTPAAVKKKAAEVRRTIDQWRTFEWDTQ